MRGLLIAASLAVGLTSCSCNQQRLSADDAAKVCVVLQACFPSEWRGGLFGSDLSSCSTGTGTYLPTSPGALIGKQPLTTGLEGPLADIYRCMLNAGGDCAKAGNCWARSGSHERCSPGSLQSGTCTGQVLSGCTADGYPFGVDCASYGGTCHVDSVFFARVGLCDLGPCPTTTTQCRGSEAESCVGPGLILGDCAAAGLACTVEQPGGARCSSPNTCTTEPPTCDGTVTVRCASGLPFRTDCAKNPAHKRCQAGVCVETGSECTVSGDRATCDGTLVKYCRDGFRRELDCVALGFPSCSGGACSPCNADGGGCICTPLSCALAGKNCGTIADGCGGTLDCGTCAAPLTCGGRGVANVCATPCTPTTCAAAGKNCGSPSNGCGSTLSCGSCTAPQTCGGGGTANVCGTGCVPTPCAAQGKNCGTTSDGCGGTLTCGNCTAPQTCGGAGTASVCGTCTPITCVAQGWDCGTAPNGCGATVLCGATCNGNRFCGGGGQNVCGRNACTPTTCAAQGKNCGFITDGCATALNCGTCTAPQSCVGNICQ